MAKRFKNVTALVKDLSEGEDFKKEAVKNISGNGLGKFLSFLRCSHQLTQGELAARMGCTQGRISKIESAKDDELSIKDFLDYGKALGLELELGFRSKGFRYVDMVKHHAFQMKKYLNRMSELAKEDDAMETGVLQFHAETILNVGQMVLDGMAKIEKSRVNRVVNSTPGQVHISGPIQPEAGASTETAACSGAGK